MDEPLVDAMDDEGVLHLSNNKSSANNAHGSEPSNNKRNMEKYMVQEIEDSN